MVGLYFGLLKVEAGKLEARYPHAYKVKHWES